MRLTAALITLTLASTSAFAKEPPAKEETATIHIYRPSYVVGMLSNYKFRINGEKLKVKNGYYYEVKVKPGNVHIKSLTAKHNTVDINAEAGKDYYVKPYIRTGILRSYVELAEVTPTFAVKDAKRTKEKHTKVIEL